MKYRKQNIQIKQKYPATRRLNEDIKKKIK